MPSELHYCIRGVKGKRWELGRKKGNDGESESEGEREGEAEEDRKRKARIPFFDSSSTSIIKAESSLGWVKKMNLKGVTMWCFFLDQCNNCQQESFMGNISSSADIQNYQ